MYPPEQSLADGSTKNPHGSVVIGLWSYHFPSFIFFKSVYIFGTRKVAIIFFYYPYAIALNFFVCLLVYLFGCLDVITNENILRKTLYS